MEIGYSFLCGQASAAGDPTVNAFLQAVDFNYTQQLDPIMGTVSLRSEWVWSHAGDRVYEDTTAADPNDRFGPLFFKNNRSGGYVMLAYRPSQASIKELRNFEGIFRYDVMDGPFTAPQGGGREQRYTVGLDYWLDARSVVKFAYECDHLMGGGGAPAFMMQFGVGF